LVEVQELAHTEQPVGGQLQVGRIQGAELPVGAHGFLDFEQSFALDEVLLQTE
jgi:hypothetical protein